MLNKAFKKISTMHFDTLFAGHGEPILQNVDMRVLDDVERLKKRSK